MSTIVTRAGKGSPLTNNEMDTNLTNLNTDKLEAADIGVSVQAYDADTAKLDVIQTFSAKQTFGDAAFTGTLTGIPVVNDFRLTLTTGVPVTTSDVTGATTIYCTPYKGNKISLYSGSVWETVASAEFSLALGTLTSGKPYDIFCYNNAGVPTLEFLVWTDDTNRATALTYQDGVLVKTGATTRRYLGTFYTTATTTTEDSVTKRYLWNYYHRVARPMVRRESTASWTYSTAAWRQSNNSASNQLNFVQGVAEDAIKFQVQEVVESTVAGDSCYSGIGIDSTSAVSSSQIGGAVQIQNAGRRHGLSCSIETTVAAGRHYATWLEYGNGSNTQTWYGTVGPVSFGINGEVFA